MAYQMRVPYGTPFMARPYMPPVAVPHAPPTNVWSEHKHDDGRPYWYNAVTGKSVWEKPAELKTHAELLMSTCSWKEFETDDGKKYYHNKETNQTVWEKPKELIEIESIGKKDGAADDGTSSTHSPAPQGAYDDPRSVGGAVDESGSASPAVSGSQTPSEGLTFTNKDDARESFKELLTEKGVASTWTWDKALKVIASDPRFNALPKMNEKKQCFNDWKVKRAKEEKDMQRKKAEEVKKNLCQLFVQSDVITPDTRWGEAVELYGTHPVFLAVPERTRKDVFDDAIHELIEAEKAQMKEERKLQQTLFAELIRKIPNLSHSTLWRDVKECILNMPAYQENEELAAASLKECLIAFEEMSNEMNKQRAEQLRIERNKVRRVERLRRDAFVALLKELTDKGQVHCESAWSTMFPLFADDERYTRMLGQPGSKPLDLFKLHVFGLREVFNEEKKVAKDILADAHVVLAPETAYDDFISLLRSDTRHTLISSSNHARLFEYLRTKAVARDEDKARKEGRAARKAAGAFKDMLLDSRKIVWSRETAWESVAAVFADDDAWKAIPDDTTRQRLYAEFLAAAEWEHQGDRKKSRRSRSRSRSPRSRSRSPSNSGDERSHRKKHKKDKKKHSSHRSSRRRRSSGRDSGSDEEGSSHHRHRHDESSSEDRDD